MYFVVNADLVKQMGPGKIAAQVAHAAIDVYNRMPKNNARYQQWKRDGQPKIVLKAPEKTLVTLIEQYPNVCCPIYDAGRTRVESGSLTVVGFTLEADELVKELSQLKLL
jgi:PTH2 family peptidyl-tRNA hydrolase